LISRMGRLMDVIRHCPFGTFVNYDRYIKIEVDFDASLDEFFNVPTTKQRVDVSDRVWDILKESGVEKAFDQLRRRFKEELRSQASEEDKGKSAKRASEMAMEEAAKLAPVVPLPIAEKQAAQAQKRLEQEAEKRARDLGLSPEQAQR